MTESWACWINALQEGKGTLPELMHDILRGSEPAWAANAYRPEFRKPDWAMLHALDFAGEVGRLSSQLEKLFATAPPGPEINGLAFRIGYPDPGVVDETVRLAVSGSREYDTRGWTLTLDWVNPDCVQDSPMMTTVFREIACDVPFLDFQREQAFFVCYQFFAMTITQWRCGRLGRTLLGPAPSRGIFFGVDAWMGLTWKPLTAQEFPPKRTRPICKPKHRPKK